MKSPIGLIAVRELLSPNSRELSLQTLCVATIFYYYKNELTEGVFQFSSVNQKRNH